MKDHSSVRFGRLVAVSFSHRVSRNPRGYRYFWDFACDCGNTKTINIESVIRGFTRSCGCLEIESRITSNTIHGKSHTVEFNAWNAMKGRCYNIRNHAYSHYGGRGIIVCDRWLNSFEHFLADMGQRPTSRHSIDRINNDGNYEQSNCRWATDTQQANNTRRSLCYEFDGESLPLSDWSVRLGIKTATLRARLNVYSMPIDEAFTRPVQIH